MTPDLETVEPQPKGMSEGARIAGVLFEPVKTYEDIAQRPTWIVPLVLVIIVVLTLLALFAQHVGWERTIRHQYETNPRLQQMEPEQRQRAMDMQIRFSGVGAYVGVICGVPIVDLIWAAILLGIVKGIMSAPVRFKQVFSVVTWAGIPGVISTILAIVVMFLKDPDDFNLQNPTVFNPGAFMDPATAPKFLYSVASSLDLFWIWTLILIGLGLKAAAGRKISTGGAMMAVFLPWIIWVLGKGALAGIFG